MGSVSRCKGALTSDTLILRILQPDCSRTVIGVTYSVPDRIFNTNCNMIVLANN